jgi:hypothetical protein
MKKYEEREMFGVSDGGGFVRHSRVSDGGGRGRRGGLRGVLCW